MHQGVPLGMGKSGPTSGAGEAAQAQGAVTPCTMEAVMVMGAVALAAA